MQVLDLNKVKSLRIEKGISQQEMANLIGMKNKANYNRYENGKYSFNADYVPKLAKALHVTIDSLFTQKVTKIETSKETAE